MNEESIIKYNRSVANKKYYEQHKKQSHRSSLLHHVKKGRVPFLRSVQLYDITIMEIVERYRIYKQSVGNVSPLKEIKMKALIFNMI